MMEWYRNLSLREQQIVAFGVLFIVFASLYVFVYEPLETALGQDKTRLALKKSEWVQLNRIAKE